jgi:hypothetical protein
MGRDAYDFGITLDRAEPRIDAQLAQTIGRLGRELALEIEQQCPFRGGYLAHQVGAFGRG